MPKRLEILKKKGSEVLLERNAAEIPLPLFCEEKVDLKYVGLKERVEREVSEFENYRNSVMSGALTTPSSPRVFSTERRSSL